MYTLELYCEAVAAWRANTNNQPLRLHWTPMTDLALAVNRGDRLPSSCDAVGAYTRVLGRRL
ncbi:hypothetical protein T4D_6990 [Trichinella pseudospiralis]|uniref:Uncharacterized protein n=1 Tax=Trichinella pseudospiralis TaxID=6337 RepID=A0A0V1FC70_TRIPS|nr:hypothetical protein T4D_6990 [Trichinella pseudospiralis]